MIMKVDREVLLNQLELVNSGLSKNDVLEQSSCYVFHDGKVITFNGEVACRHECCLKIEGAVRAEPLNTILSKLVEETVEINTGTSKDEEGELLIKGKGRKTGIRLENDILLPVTDIPSPKKWHKLPENFMESLRMVHHCVSKESKYRELTCVHFHPERIEASDNFQVTRFDIKLPIKKSVLIEGTSAGSLSRLDVIELAYSQDWLHFRTSDKLVFSCRRYLDEYPELGPLLEFEGKPITMPKGLIDAADKAQVFSKEAEENQVLVELRADRLRIKGEGSSGWFTEVKKVRYKGAPMSFRIDPSLLQELLKKHTECEITDDRLKVDGGSWTYITCLAKV